MIILDVDQGSEQWHKARAGIPTASEFKKIYTSTGKASTQADVYMRTLLAEWLVGGPTESYTNHWIERGKELEDEAREHYAFEADMEVTQVGFVYANEDRLYGASPDGLVGEDGLVQFKCPKGSTQIEYLFAGKIPSEYIVQVQGEMLVTDKKWSDFVSYFPGMPRVKIRIARDERLIMGLGSALGKFIVQMLDKRKKLEVLGYAPQEER